MEWQFAFLLIVGGLLLLLASGLPVAFSFMLVNLIGVFVLWGGEAGLNQIILSFLHSVATFILIPVPLFMLMGEVMFHSGMAVRMMDALDKWMGRLPGRLSLLAVGGGTLFSVLSGSSMSSVAMLGSTLVPEMEKRGYKKPMTIGPVMGSGGLAMIIPPSSLGVLLAGLGKMSVAKLLISGIIPGLIIAVFYASYIIIRCRLQPSLTPTYEMTPVPILDKLRALVRHVLPLGLIIFLVLGLIFLGIATPSEAAATGTLGAFILALLYRGLNLGVVKTCINSTIKITVMVLTVILGAIAFSQILAYSGVREGLVELFTGLPLSPLLIVIAMQVAILILGSFMDAIGIMMITIPIFMPIIRALGIDPIWFGLLMLVNLEMGSTTPPFGLLLYVMKGVAPADATMGDIIRAGIPFLLCDAVAMALIIAFPVLALWLPGIMR